MKLTPRLKAVAALVPVGDRVADIGSDHAYIPVELIRSGQASTVIASDVHQGPVENAKKVVTLAELEDRIQVRLGSGFDVYGAGEIDTAILAGMGGFLIRDLISDAMHLVKTLNRLVLQPMVAMRELRVWLLENGFELCEEQIAQEGEKFYEIFSVKYTGVVTSPVSLRTAELGNSMVRENDELSIRYMAYRIRKTETVLSALRSAKTPDPETLEIFKTRLELLREVLACLSIQKKS